MAFPVLVLSFILAVQGCWFAVDLLPLRRLGRGERQGDGAAADVPTADDGAAA